MKNISMRVNDINRIAAFLAKRDIEVLSSKALYSKFGLSQVDMLILLGNSFPFTAQMTADAYRNGLAKEVMIVGGIGHSTQYLVDNVLKIKEYKRIEVQNKSEADILKQILMKWGKIKAYNILIENQSTNCGSNAQEALKVIKKTHRVVKSILLIQDPTMQLRSHASFLKEWEVEETLVMSYAPFIPKLRLAGKGYMNKEVRSLWPIDRFVDLIMGEIPRSRDDEQGYGPKGKGFIAHVDIPEDVMNAYERLLLYYGDRSR